jgi:hypothetical protein
MQRSPEMSDTSKIVTCAKDGTSHATFVCRHLAGNAGLGFFAADDEADPRPDAWCGACDEVLKREGEWNERSESFARIKLICAGCYDRARLRNRPSDPVLSSRGYDCAACGKHHHELPLDFAFDSPLYYQEIAADEREGRCFLNEDLCVIDDKDYFIRGCLEIPILDVPARFTWGIWTSLSKKSYDRVLELWDSEEQLHEPPYFGWLSSAIPGYPETHSLKTHVHSRRKEMRPYVELERTDHPLAIEQHKGITLNRAVAIAETLMHQK